MQTMNTLLRICSGVNFVFGVVAGVTRDYGPAAYFMALAIYLRLLANE